MSKTILLYGLICRVLVSTVMVASVIVASVIVASQVFAAPLERLDYFVFLVTGKSTAGTAKEEIEQMQKAHIANFERLAALGELSAAGPCSDPGKTVRGIVVVQATSLAEAEGKFGADPYVTDGFMKTEIHPYKSLVGKFVVPADKSKMDTYTIAIASRAAKWTEGEESAKAVQDAFQLLAKEQYSAGKLGFAAMFNGPSNNASPRVAVMVFRGEEQAAVERLFSEWKLIQDGVVKVQVFPQYLVKDALPSE